MLEQARAEEDPFVAATLLVFIFEVLVNRTSDNEEHEVCVRGLVSIGRQDNILANCGSGCGYAVFSRRACLSCFRRNCNSMQRWSTKHISCLITAIAPTVGFAGYYDTADISRKRSTNGTELRPSHTSNRCVYRKYTNQKHS